MSDNLKLTTQEYVEKKLSAFTPGPSVKEITSNDGTITVTPGADGKVDLHADKGLTLPIKADGHVIIPNTRAYIGPVDYSGYIAVGDNGSIAIKSNRGIEIGSDTTFVVGPGEHVYLHGTELTNGGGGGGGGQDYSNQIWKVYNDRYFGDKNLSRVHFCGNEVSIDWSDGSIVSASEQEGITLGAYYGDYNTALVSPKSLRIRPTYSNYPWTGLDISANNQTTYISGPVKFSEIYDKNNNEITAGGGGYASIAESDYELTLGTSELNIVRFKCEEYGTIFVDGPMFARQPMHLGSSTFVSGPLYISGSTFVSGPLYMSYYDSSILFDNTEDKKIYIDNRLSGGPIKIEWKFDEYNQQSAIAIGENKITLEINGEICSLSADDLNKLRNIIDSY